ncbi:MAG TPA: 2,3-bisphosphoglycerate-independent phosphoglycerate mutase, partial [Alphaproteobacteria bacterium]|nr:2,3-bisphosphoglycerate-independent phosphoglycerate mutase [Alphaproteobacteria bacterium]
ATYDLQPEMSAGEVTDALTHAIKAGAHDLIVVNYANPDMVGHTGVMAAALKAVAFVDECLGRVVEAVDEVGGTLLVTADHGNIELMMDQQTGEPQTSHTIGDVPFILYPAQQGRMLNQGSLCDIAPTILGLMGIKQPSAMTGKSLLN